MKNPLTSKERRGLTAVAAAALLCIGLGFVVRSCGSLSPKGGAVVVVDEGDSVSEISEISEKSDGKRGRREKSRKAEKKGRSNKKKKAEKSYPVRDPLSQPCD
ncbi:MAG: hypothetical protein K2K75_00700 [Muribaculaceae bacterium]|nr:hypothetical protein [Muribaculaceae bacterium]